MIGKLDRRTGRPRTPHPRVYFAGKIAKNDWRETICEDLQYTNGNLYMTGHKTAWPVLPQDGYSYTGPYLY